MSLAGFLQRGKRAQVLVDAVPVESAGPAGRRCLHVDPVAPARGEFLRNDEILDVSSGASP